LEWETKEVAISADDLKFKKYKQMYEPTAPHAVETGVMAETPFNCFMTAPEKGLKLYTITYSDKTTKTVAIMPILGPYGNEKRFGCYPETLQEAYKFGAANFRDDGAVGEPNTSGYLMSFHPGGTGYTTWTESTVDSFYNPAKARVATFGNYDEGPARLYKVFDNHSPKGLNCLVVGSAPNPWVEGILLAYDAAYVTTSEYQVPVIPKESKWASKTATIHHEASPSPSPHTLLDLTLAEPTSNNPHRGSKNSHNSPPPPSPPNRFHTLTLVSLRNSSRTPSSST
jgi:hypothetical protein